MTGDAGAKMRPMRSKWSQSFDAPADFHSSGFGGSGGFGDGFELERDTDPSDELRVEKIRLNRSPVDARGVGVWVCVLCVLTGVGLADSIRHRRI